MSAIVTENVVRKFGEVTAVDGVSLRVEPGEVFGFLGPNGSGKTTLFRILSTLIAPQAGRVTMMGLDLTTRREQVRRQIGVVFQSPSLDKQLTAEENLRHQGHLYGMSGSELERRIDEMLKRVGLSERPKEYVGNFSGGMRRWCSRGTLAAASTGVSSELRRWPPHLQISVR